MTKMDFFRGKEEIVATPELFFELMTSEFPEVMDNYELEEPVIVDCSEIYNGKSFPIILMGMVSKDNPEICDYLTYIPEIDFYTLSLGNLNFRKLHSGDVGRKFEVQFSDRTAEGEVILRNGKYCLKYKS